MSLSEVEWPVRQFLETRYPANIEESLAGPPEGVTRINVVSGDLKDEADWNLDVLSESPDSIS